MFSRSLITFTMGRIEFFFVVLFFVFKFVLLFSFTLEADFG